MKRQPENPRSHDYLDDLKQELPELFQPRELDSSWDDELIIIPIDDPESASGSSETSQDSLAPGNCDNSDWLQLESCWDVGQNETKAPQSNLSQLIVQVLGGAHGGAPTRFDPDKGVRPPDSLAFYLPFHYYHPVWWGVYLTFEGVLWLADEIVKRSNNTVAKQQAIQAARLFLYHHEAFHHKTECFATRLELTHRQPFYKTGFERLYQETFGKESCLEEGLANASALKDSDKKLRTPQVDKALESYVLDNPPGSNKGVAIRKNFNSERCVFAEKNQNICLPQLPSKLPSVWQTTPHMFDGIANIKSRVNYVIHRNSTLATRLPFRPLLPSNRLVKKLKELVGLKFLRNGGNHDIYQLPTGRTIPIPRHQRDLGRGLVRSILREAGVNMGLEDFLRT